MNRPPRTTRRCWPILATLVLAASFAMAQRPLNSPHYYLVTAPVLTPGAPVEGALTREDGQNFVDGRRVDVLVLRPEPGDALTLEVTSDEFDPFMTVFDPGGEVLLSVDDGPEGLNPRGTLTFERGGAHLLVVSGYDPEDLGAYRATAREARTDPAARLPVPGRVDAALAPSDAPHPVAQPGPARSFEVVLSEARLVRFAVTSYSGRRSRRTPSSRTT